MTGHTLIHSWVGCIVLGSPMPNIHWVEHHGNQQVMSPLPASPAAAAACKCMDYHNAVGYGLMLVPDLHQDYPLITITLI
jgi:hypothetical protein